MAYENYSFVSWADLTPITSVRLQQMSTNIDQVKDATSNNPKGLQKLKNIYSNITVDTANALNTYELIYLKDEGNGTDNRLTTDVGRYYKITLAFPGISVAEAGAEDSLYTLSIKEGVFGSTNTTVTSYKLSSSPGLFVNVASASASVSNINLNTNFRFGAGTYTYVLAGDGTQNRSFFAEITKTAGSSGANRPSAYNVVASDTVMQMYIEDIGGVA